jgi:hypothetical protein
MGSPESRLETENIGMRTDGRRRKGNQWKKEIAKDSKDRGWVDITVSSNVAPRDSYRATAMLAGCDV